MFRLITLLLTLVPVFAFAGPCKVTSVNDGDTFTCLNDRDDLIKVRLAEIDAPEQGQTYGEHAKQALYNLINSEFVKLNIQDTDSYGRTVARVTRGDGVDVNAALVQAGAAWVYPKHLKDRSLLRLEAEAKSIPRGLWTLPSADQVQPWVWRATNRTTSAQNGLEQPKRQTSFSQFDSPTGSFNCSTLKHCGQMSCAEARYQLVHCANPHIDGDRDGRPCERQCQ